MKKIQIIELFRNIKKTSVSFVSIAVFIALGTCAYLGLNWSSTSFSKMIDNTVNDWEMYNADIIYPYGFTDEFIQELNAIDDVDKAEGYFVSEEAINIENRVYQARIMSLTKDVNIAKVQEGSLPNKKGEIAIQKMFADNHNIKLGDEIVFEHNDQGDAHALYYLFNEDLDGLQNDKPTEDGIKELLTDRYTVVALVDVPQYIIQSNLIYGVSSTSTPIDCVMFVDKSSFDSKSYIGYSNVAVRNKDLDKYLSLSSEYDAANDEFINKIQPLTDKYTKERNAQILQSIKNIENDIIAEINNGENELKEAEEKLGIFQDEIDDGKQELIDAKKLLDTSQNEVDEGWEEVNKNKAIIESEEKKLETIQKVYDTTIKVMDAIIFIDDNQDSIKQSIIIIHSFLDVYREIIKNELPDDYYTLELLDQLYEKINSGYYDTHIDEFEKDYLLIVDKINNSEAYASIEKIIADLNEKAENNEAYKELLEALLFINAGYDENINYPKKITDAYNKIKSVSKDNLLALSFVDKINKEVKENNNEISLDEELKDLLNCSVEHASSITDISEYIESVLDGCNERVDDIYNTLLNSSIKSEINEKKSTLLPEDTDGLIECEVSEAYYDLALNLFEVYKTSERSEVLETELILILTVYNSNKTYFDETIPFGNELMTIIANFYYDLDSYIYEDDTSGLAVRYLKFLDEINKGNTIGAFEYYIALVKDDIENGNKMLDDPYLKLAEEMQNLLYIYNGVTEVPTEVIELYREIKDDKALMIWIETLISNLIDEKLEENNLPTLKEIITFLDENLDDDYTKFEEIASLISEYYAEFADKTEEIRQILLDNKYLLDDARDELNEAINMLQSAINKLNESQKQVDSGYAEYRKGLSTLNVSEKEFIEAVERIEKGKQEILDGQDILKEYQDMTREIEGYDNAILGRSANASLAIGKIPIDIMNNIKYSLALIFVLVGVFICYSAISRIVFEDTKLIGTKKALGLKKKEITKSYLIYGLLAAVLGSILGNILAVYVIEPIVNMTLTQDFVAMENQYHFDIKDSLVFFLFEACSSLLFAYLACHSVIKKKAITLLNGNDEKIYKEHFYEKLSIWKKLPLFNKTVINNFVNDKRRVFATVVGVVGCCSLLVSSLTIYVNAKRSLEYHMENIYNFNAVIYLDTSKEYSLENVEGVLDREGIDYSPIYYSSVSIKKDDGSYVMSDVYSFNDDRFTNFFNISQDGKSIKDISDGVWVSQVYADVNNLKPGDYITVVDNKGNETRLKVGGAYDYYLLNLQLIVNASTFEEINNKEYIDNAILLNHDDIDGLSIKLKDVEGFSSIIDSDKQSIDGYAILTDIIMIIVVIYFVLAFVLAFLVLLNLYTMFVSEKKKDLIIMMINGYYTKDVKKYIYKDTIFLTIIGIVAGCVLGVIVGFITISGFDSDFVKIMKTVSVEVCVGCGVITIVLSIINYLIAIRKVKTFKLSDLAK